MSSATPEQRADNAMSRATPEQRAEALRLFQEFEKAHAAYDAAIDDCPAADAIRQKYRGLERQLREQREAELGSLELYKSRRSACDAHTAFPFEIEVAWNGERCAAVCAKSGVPILTVDEYLCDEITGEYFLRSALGLPPRTEVSTDEHEEAA